MTTAPPQKRRRPPSPRSPLADLMFLWSLFSAWLAKLEHGFAYRQIMYWVVAEAFAAAVRGHIVGWGKLERKATVGMPVPSASG